MTGADKALIESRFNNLELVLKASECTICSKVDGLEQKFEDTKAIVDEHVNWHNSLNRRIAGSTIKYGLVVFTFVVVVVFILGMQGGIIPSVISKMIG